MSPSPWATRAAAVAAVWVVALAGLGFLITQPTGLFNQYSDLVSEQLATQTVLHDAWTAGRSFPLWRSDQLSGGPALTNPQAIYTHPLHLLFALFSPSRVVGLVIWLELVLAALGGYATAAALRLSVPARLLTAVGVLFSFKTVLAVYAGWLPVLASIAAVPWLVAATVAMVERPALRTVLAGTAAGTLALHAGQPQLIFYTVLLLGLWCAIVLVRSFMAGQRAMALRSAGALALAAALAAGLSAYRLLPIVSDLPLLTRAWADGTFFLGSTPFPAWGLLTAFSPEYFGSPLDGRLVEAWEYVFYLGVVPSLLAVAGGIWGHRRRHVTTLCVAVLLTAGLAIDSPVVRTVAAVVPGYGLFRIPPRILFLTAFFAYGLAGFGMEEVMRRVPSRRRVLVGAVLVLATAGEGTYWARRYLQTPDPIPYPLQAPYLDALRSVEPSRIAPLSTSLPNFGAAAPLGLQLVTGFDPFNFTHYQTYMDIVQYGRPLGPRPGVWTTLDRVARWDLLDALNVHHVVAPAPIEVGDGVVLAASFTDQLQFHYYEGLARGPVYVYRNDRSRGRAFFASSVHGAASEADMIAAVLNGNVRDEAVVLGTPDGSSTASPADDVQVLRASGGALEVAATNARRRFLLVSEVWHPGWSATVDGQPARLMRADIALQGLWLEPGSHRVELRFWPTGLSAGLAASAVTAMIVMLLGALALRTGRRT